MCKFSWICEKSQLEDVPSFRWRVFVEMGDRALLLAFRKHSKLISHIFKNEKPSDEDLESLRETVKFFNDETVRTTAIAWAMAHLSYKHEEIYEELWRVCKMLAKSTQKKINKGKIFTAIDKMGTQDALMTALASNIVMTDIDTISVEEADKRVAIMSVICEKRQIDIAGDDEPANSLIDFETDDEHVIEELYYMLLVQSYQFTHQYQKQIELEELLEEVKDSKSLLSKQVRTDTKALDKLNKLTREQELRIKKLSDSEETFLANNKLCVTPCDNPIMKKMQQDFHDTTEKFESQVDIIETLTLTNMDLKEQLDYYDEVNKVIMSDYMSEELNEIEDVPDELLRSRLHGYRLVIYGGHERWKTALKNYLDLIKIHYSIETSFSSKQRTTDIVIYNMCSMSHADYWNYLRKTASSPVKTNLAFLRGTGRLKMFIMSLLDEMQNSVDDNVTE